MALSCDAELDYLFWAALRRLEKLGSRGEMMDEDIKAIDEQILNLKLRRRAIRMEKRR